MGSQFLNGPLLQFQEMFLNKLIFFLLVCIFSVPEISAKVRFLSFQYNRPDFLEFQWRLLEKFILDDYELVVFDDAANPDLEIAIRNICKTNSIQYVRFEQKWHRTDPLNEYIYHVLHQFHIEYNSMFSFCNGIATVEEISQHPGIRHNHVIQYALDHFGYDHDDIVVILDHDLFPMKPISIRMLLKDVPLVGIERIEKSGITHIWVPFVAFDPKRLPNIRDLKFHGDVIDNCYYDSGTSSYYYLKNNPRVPYKLCPRSYDKEFYHLPFRKLKDFGFSREEIVLIKNLPGPGCIEFYVDHQFLHYVGGYIDFDPIKQAAVVNFLKTLLKKPT